MEVLMSKVDEELESKQELCIKAYALGFLDGCGIALEQCDAEKVREVIAVLSKELDQDHPAHMGSSH
jgi:hypothetical protein